MVGEPDRLRAAALGEARVLDDRVELQRSLPRDRVVVLREREPDVHRGEATEIRFGALRRAPTLAAVLECVINVSEGRDMDRLLRIARACGPALVDVHADADHHRSVFTLAGPGSARRGRRRPVTRGGRGGAVLDRRPRGRTPPLRRARRRAVRRPRGHHGRAGAGRGRGPRVRRVVGARVRGAGVPLRRGRSRGSRPPERALDELPQPPARLRTARRRTPVSAQPQSARVVRSSRQLRAREPRHQRGAPDRPRHARTLGRAPRRARARVLPARGQTRPGLDEPRRARPHRRAGRVPARAQPRAALRNRRRQRRAGRAHPAAATSTVAPTTSSSGAASTRSRRWKCGSAKAPAGGPATRRRQGSRRSG